MGRRETKKKNYFIVCGLKCPRAFILFLRLYNLTPWMNGYLQADNWKWTHFRLQVCPCVVFFFWCVTFTSWTSLKQETLERSEVTVVPFTCPSLQSLFFNALISLNGDWYKKNIHMAAFSASCFRHSQILLPVITSGINADSIFSHRRLKSRCLWVIVRPIVLLSHFFLVAAF